MFINKCRNRFRNKIRRCLPDVNVDQLRVIADYQQRYVFLEEWLERRRWYAVCLLYQHDGHRITAAVDGQVVGIHVLQEADAAKATNITIGFIDPRLHPGGSFVGNVTQFNVWNRILTEEEVKDVAFCKSNVQGNSISWEDDWIFQNAVQYDLKQEDLCFRDFPPKFQVFPAMDHAQGTYLCAALGGSLVTPKHMVELTHMYLTAQTQKRDCNLIWVGVTDEIEEGLWSQPRSGLDPATLPWAFGEPNGLRYENCAGIEPAGVTDENCEMKRCPICNMTERVAMTLRGSCEANPHNTKYTMLLRNEEISFEGYGDYTISLKNEKWVWINASHNETIAQMNPSRYNYPLGRQRWQLRSPVCGQEAGQVRQLLLTRCHKEQFTCDDGTCVDLDQRCDGKHDCYDFSDETACEIVRLPPEYKVLFHV